MEDLLKEDNNEEDFAYPIIHLSGDDIEIALTHSKSQYSEQYYSFVNGQNTTQGGTHLNAYREAIVATLRNYYNKPYDASDIRKSIIGAISIKVMEPIFESQTKTKLGSTEMGEGMPSVRTYITNFVQKHLDDYLHKQPEIAEEIQKKSYKQSANARNYRIFVSCSRPSKESEPTQQKATRLSHSPDR